MKSLLFLIIQIIDLYQLVLIIYVIATWLVGFRIINTTNAFVYSILTALYKICEPSMRIVKKFIQNGGYNEEVPTDFYGKKNFIFKKVGKMITPSIEEIKLNNRSRSAKLRIAEKI